MQNSRVIQEAIALAGDCISSGNLARAKSLLGASKDFLNNSEINRMLGIAEAISGDSTKALEFFNRAIRLDSKNSNAYSNRGNIYKIIGNISEALSDYSLAIKLEPENSDAYYNRGLMNEALNQIEFAVQDYSMALNINPDYFDAYLKVALILIGAQKYREALDCLKIVVARNPYIFDVWLNMGFSFNALEEFNLALECHDKALALSPGDPRVLTNRGVTFEGMGLLDKALICYEAAIQINPRDHVPHAYCGYIFYRQKKYNNALVCFEAALNICPDFVDAWCNKGMTLMELGLHDDARRTFFKALKCDPNHALSHLNLGQLLLRLFEFKDGWAEYDWRWKCNNNDSDFYVSDKPLWQGQDGVENIFVWAEQGIGDQILYATLLPELRKYAKSITVAIDKKLVNLFKQTYPDVKFLDKKSSLFVEDFDYQIPIAGLPQILRPNLNSFFSAKRAHLSCNPSLLANVSQVVTEKISPEKKKCGLSWFSGNQKVGRDKSIPIGQLAPILSLGKFEFIDLQCGDTNQDRKAVHDQMGIAIHKFEQIDNNNDLAGLLALISACDVVVTVSNTTAHMAAGLGKETLLLLPFSAGKFWYWHNFEGKSLWYDRVLTFEQIEQGHWGDPVARVAQYLVNF